MQKSGRPYCELWKLSCCRSRLGLPCFMLGVSHERVVARPYQTGKTTGADSGAHALRRDYWLLLSKQACWYGYGRFGAGRSGAERGGAGCCGVCALVSLRSRPSALRLRTASHSMLIATYHQASRWEPRANNAFAHPPTGGWLPTITPQGHEARKADTQQRRQGDTGHRCLSHSLDQHTYIPAE